MVENVFIFKTGLPGLPEELKEFQFISLQKDSPFYLLRSVHDEKICFVLINPFVFFPDYEFDLPEEDKTKINVTDLKDVAVFCIVNASKGIKKATVNLLAPVVFNIKVGLARQVVLSDKRYNIRQPLSLSAEHGGE